jgi:hypothetical protein
MPNELLNALSQDRNLGTRDVLRLLGTGTATGLAACTGGNETGPSGSSTEAPTESDTDSGSGPDSTETDTDSGGEETDTDPGLEEINRILGNEEIFSWKAAQQYHLSGPEIYTDEAWNSDSAVKSLSQPGMGGQREFSYVNFDALREPESYDGIQWLRSNQPNLIFIAKPFGGVKAVDEVLYQVNDITTAVTERTSKEEREYWNDRGFSERKSIGDASILTPDTGESVVVNGIPVKAVTLDGDRVDLVPEYWESEITTSGNGPIFKNPVEAASMPALNRRSRDFSVNPDERDEDYNLQRFLEEVKGYEHAFTFNDHPNFKGHTDEQHVTAKGYTGNGRGYKFMDSQIRRKDIFVKPKDIVSGTKRINPSVS